MKRLAKATLEERGDDACSPGLKKAASGSLDHAERDLLKTFEQLGMTIDVAISLYRFGLVHIAHIKVAAWFRYLLKFRSDRLFGGFQRSQAESQLAMKCFWENLRGVMPDHSVYRTHGDRLKHCIPFYLFMDEGVGLRKSGVLVISLQAVLGCSTAHLFSRKARSRDFCEAEMLDIMTESQTHNAAGRTYESRFLYTVLPKKVYKKNGNLDKLLDRLAQECVDVLDGIQIRGQTYYPVCLGLKGDAPQLITVGHFKRGFSHMGKNIGCCWECQAGEAGFPFEDTGFSPVWASTLYSVRPYTTPSPLLRIPARTIPEQFFNRDPFHTFKQSIGCSFLSSSIVFLCEQGYFPGLHGESEAVTAQLERAYRDFAHYTKNEWPGKTMQSLKMFTKELFKRSRKDHFPAGRFKGSDVMLMLRWVQFAMLHGFVQHTHDPPSRPDCSPITAPLHAWHAPFFKHILKGCEGGLRFFNVVHRNGIWLPRDRTRQLGLSAAEFTQSFSALAKLSLELHLPRYHLVPALHAMHHFYVDAQNFLRMRPPLKFSLNPGVTNCEADEDFVGKVARLSRKVHARSTTMRTLERYRVKMWCEAHDIR